MTPRIMGVEADDHVGLRERPVGGGLVTRLPLVAAIVGLTFLVVPDQGGPIRQGLAGVDKDWERLVLDVDQFQRVPGDIGILGDDTRNLLALKADLVGRQHRLGVSRQCRHPRQLVGIEVGPRDDGDHAG